MTRDELLRIIEQAAKERTKSLKISKSGLIEVPPEIGMLKDLTWLDLSDNQVSMIPPEIGMLTKVYGDQGCPYRSYPRA